MLQAKQLGSWYQDPQDALYEDVEPNLEAGKMYAILGASGSGKTTFLSLISKLDAPEEGEVYYRDHSLNKAGLRGYRRNDVSIILQACNLLPYLSALDSVIAAMEITKAKQENYRQVALDRLARMGIGEMSAKKQMVRFSGGQQQRIAIVRAICCEHQLIVADKPTENLGETTLQDIVKLFREITHEQNRCIIIVTHEIEVAESYDKVFKLKDRKFQKIEV